ncbi:MAG: hypothetical protein IM653_05160 [Phenylobacterium sp.]|uniref:hypothetical protein n=1 Tax=Phenylobacterium sp. TaxID=1871053 RepID=UPI0025EAE06E|nr:hypothetical protein [Phenylobacterium sp.]MCA6224994.1 hypothetical protein [Phenylobacterium sp.]MCA6226676.1 hypothetical protein [Phenylobacterium sp.]MCA6232227.1 hypothetical protein [Phenylobacterium sp.]MCA6234507.1 hypothetical protein [Phenylobacterium sp.]MCA6250605.1 hypothetical protein [Phenylobacterium sp.]
MTRTDLSKTLSLRRAFDREILRREDERLAREERDRAQQEADHAAASALHDILASDPDFLRERGLKLERTRYAVTLDHPDFRLRAFFEAGEASVSSADKRTATSPTAAPRKQAVATSVSGALDLFAQYLADESPSC